MNLEQIVFSVQFINSFHANFFFLFLWKHQKTGGFKGDKKGTFVRNGLTFLLFYQLAVFFQLTRPSPRSPNFQILQSVCYSVYYVNFLKFVKKFDNFIR